MGEEAISKLNKSMKTDACSTSCVQIVQTNNLPSPASCSPQWPTNAPRRLTGRAKILLMVRVIRWSTEHGHNQGASYLADFCLFVSLLLAVQHFASIIPS